MKKVNGFTLIEVLTAAMLFGVVIIFVFEGYFRIKNNFELAIKQQNKIIEINQLEFSFEKEVLSSKRILIDSINQKIKFNFINDSSVTYAFIKDMIVKINLIGDTVYVYNMTGEIDNWSYQKYECDKKNEIKLINFFSIKLSPFSEIDVQHKFYKTYPIETIFNECNE